MIRYLTHPDGRFWMARAVDDYVLVRHGVEGGEVTEDAIDAYDRFSKPPEYCLDDLAAHLEGYEWTPIPDVHLEIERAHSITLPEPIRTFYATGKYLEYEDKWCEQLGCGLDFVDDSVLGNYYAVHYDREQSAEREFVPISARVINGFPDEQSWIGIDPTEGDGPVYALYTSGEFDKAYDSLDAFLADVVDAPE